VKGSSALKEIEAKRAAKRAKLDTSTTQSKNVEVEKKEDKEKDAEVKEEELMETEAVEGIMSKWYFKL